MTDELGDGKLLQAVTALVTAGAVAGLVFWVLHAALKTRRNLAFGAVVATAGLMGSTAGCTNKPPQTDLETSPPSPPNYAPVSSDHARTLMSENHDKRLAAWERTRKEPAVRSTETQAEPRGMPSWTTYGFLFLAICGIVTTIFEFVRIVVDTVDEYETRDDGESDG